MRGFYVNNHHNTEVTCIVSVSNHTGNHVHGYWSNQSKAFKDQSTTTVSPKWGTPPKVYICVDSNQG